MNRAKKIYLALVFLLIFHSRAFAGYIDIGKIIWIESKGNAVAYNKGSGARGICQITPICLKEWNNYHPEDLFTLEDLWNKDINIKIATWYLENRIPQMLKYYGFEITYRNIIICYNAGIDYLVSNRELKKETINYIKQYERIK